MPNSSIRQIIQHIIQQPRYQPVLVIALAVAVMALLTPWSKQWFEFARPAIDDGQWWRLLTGNLLHTNTWHLVMNLAGLAILAALHGEHYRRRSLWLFSLANASAVGLCLYLFSPTMDYYVGLSGYLHGLLLWGALHDIGKGYRSGYLLAVGVIGKTLYEQWYGASEQVAQLINASVAVDAHLYGVLATLPLFALHLAWRRRCASRR